MLWFRGLGFQVSGYSCTVDRLGLRVSGFRNRGFVSLGLRAYGLGHIPRKSGTIQGARGALVGKGLRIPGFGFIAYGLGLQV